MGIFRYALRDTGRLFFRHWGLNVLALLSTMAVFFLVGASCLLTLNVHRIVSGVEDQLTIQAYLRAPAALEDLARDVATYPHVTDVRAVTPEEALDVLRSRLGSRAQVVTLVGENPLPASMEIRVDRAASVALVARRLMTLDQVDDVVYAGELAQRLARFSAFMARFCSALLPLSLAGGALVIFNTSRMAVYSRREEIRVMLQVGATQTFVALPFVLQGAILGLTGAVLASLALLGTYRTVANVLQVTLPFLTVLREPAILFKLAAVLVGGGVSVGWLFSWMAVARYVRSALRPL